MNEEWKMLYIMKHRSCTSSRLVRIDGIYLKQLVFLDIYCEVHPTGTYQRTKKKLKLIVKNFHGMVLGRICDECLKEHRTRVVNHRGKTWEKPPETLEEKMKKP